MPSTSRPSRPPTTSTRCDCSRKELGPGPYPGRCRTRGLAAGRGRGVRVELGPGVERFDDGLLGPQAQEPAAQSGDLLLRDRLGNWTYQFAVVVDDLRQGVDLVVRGADLLDSTGRQLALGRLLGRPAPPVFLHHPLILKPSGEKLSKANRDTGLGELRARGGARTACWARRPHAAGCCRRRAASRWLNWPGYSRRNLRRDLFLTKPKSGRIFSAHAPHPGRHPRQGHAPNSTTATHARVFASANGPAQCPAFRRSHIITTEVA